jgi:hypothetical protein
MLSGYWQDTADEFQEFPAMDRLGNISIHPRFETSFAIAFDRVRGSV